MKNLCRFALFAACLTAAAAHADTVNFTLTPPIASVPPGGTATYTATISAPATNAAPVFLNGDSITLADPTGITYNDYGLFGNFPISLNPGDSDSGAPFTISVDPAELPGDYLGSYVLEGGADANAQTIIGTQQFTVDVSATAPTSVTPEPSSFLLLLTGVLATVGFAVRKRMVSATQM